MQPKLEPSTVISAILTRHKTWMFEDEILREASSHKCGNRLCILAALGRMWEDGLVEIDVELIGEDEYGPTRSLYRWKS